MGCLQFWMRYLFETFWRHSWDIGTLVPNDCEFLVCLSVCQLAYFLTEIRQIWGYLQFWMRYLFETFWRHSLDVGTLVPNNCEFLVCLSVCQLANFLTEIRQIQGYVQFWMRYLSETFWRQSWDLGTLDPNNYDFLYVCQSVSWLIGIYPVLDEAYS